DWNRPWVRSFRLNGTEVVFAGTPGGDRQEAAGAVLAAAVRRVLPPHVTPGTSVAARGLEAAQ
ncbi:MAG: hypothetical protein SNJ79_11415, partial [Sphingomonadaceae bacterium]